MIKPWFVFIHFIHHTLHWLNFACIFATKVKSYNKKIKKTVGKNKMVLPSNYVMNAFSYSIPAVRYSLSDRALIGSAVATKAPWRLTSWLPQSCSNWQLSARDSFTDWKNWFDSRQHHASMRICHYSERNSPSLSGHLNAFKCCSKTFNFENFSS